MDHLFQCLTPPSGTIFYAMNNMAFEVRSRSCGTQLLDTINDLTKIWMNENKQM